MDNVKSQLLEKIQSANNILVTVSSNPSVDQLAACIGLTLIINKLKKHGTAVFSGDIPSTIEFLQPEQTLEKNTDSLRDFIIALDKTKADKLRYKVEDEMVRIFITPYRTSITSNDLEFSQGDFNVDLVIAIGVTQQNDLDQAIISHGRILHDATLTSINMLPDGGLGSINWIEPETSSLSELIVSLAQDISGDILDEQISTALLTGIVAETERFSNNKTTSRTMSISADLMKAGANQQLIATKLDEATQAKSLEKLGEEATVLDQASSTPEDEESNEIHEPEDGTLEIEHSPDTGETNVMENSNENSQAPSKEDSSELQKGDVDDSSPLDQLNLELGDEAQPNQLEATMDNLDSPLEDLPTPSPISDQTGPRLITEPPTLGGRLTANSEPERLDPSSDPLSLTLHPPQPLLERTQNGIPSTEISPVSMSQEGLLKAETDQSNLNQITTLPNVSPVQNDLDEAQQLNTSHEVQNGPIVNSQAESSSEKNWKESIAPSLAIDDVRDEVTKALNSPNLLPPPVDSTPLPSGVETTVNNTNLAPPQPNAEFAAVLQQTIPPTGRIETPFPNSVEALPSEDPIPALVLPPAEAVQLTPSLPVVETYNPNAPPPVPPPLPFPFNSSSPPQQ